MRKGRIVKLIGGVYTVLDEQGKRHALKPRGKFRHLKTSPKVGDIARFDEQLIHDIEERTSDLDRPPVANVERAILVNSAKEPPFSSFLLDRFLLLIEAEGIEPVIVVNKADLFTAAEREKLQKELAYYETFYHVIFFSATTKEGVDRLKDFLAEKVSVFAGQTGTGKSSILNVLDSSLSLKVGDISKALGRGRHTTRHVELVRVGAGLVADTPGFSKLDLPKLEPEEVSHHYPDLFEISHDCRFRGCTHMEEPGCAVKEAVKRGDVPERRYENYRRILQEINERPKRY